MELVINNSKDVTVVTLKSEVLDANNSKEFKKNMAPVIKNGGKVVFNLENVQFIDSAGLGVILSCLRTLNKEGGDLKLFGITKPVRALFELVRMHRIFNIYNTEEEAVQSFLLQETVV